MKIEKINLSLLFIFNCKMGNKHSNTNKKNTLGVPHSIESIYKKHRTMIMNSIKNQIRTNTTIVIDHINNAASLKIIAELKNNGYIANYRPLNSLSKTEYNIVWS